LVPLYTNKINNQVGGKIFSKNTLTQEWASSNIGLTNNRKGGAQMREGQYSLKELRARHGLTQAKTAKMLEISTQTYNAWERDFGMVKMQSAVRVAALFEVEVDKIFFDD
jgi:DNA-binding XRE family transcriptional regulator